MKKPLKLLLTLGYIIIQIRLQLKSVFTHGKLTIHHANLAELKGSEIANLAMGRLQFIKLDCTLGQFVADVCLCH